MVDTFNYAFTLNESGVHVLRSTVESFNLKQVTDKDIISFYQNFSNSAAFDTGLLPLDGTGVLAIRAAGNQMQITVQHKPGIYYINWGEYEGHSGAKTYNLAQPYRIIIGDFVDGQLLGARMFYSPYPITHPDMPLYHVNLPNINCKGYHNNAVGWICLYLREDWSALPLNEKISRFIERCSGVETYNDANMSETDGSRFYKEKFQYNTDKDFSYLWDPNSWQQKSLDEGFNWTLDEQNWIPVKVKSIDDQGNHFEDGIQLTLSGALLGNYQAYYTDKNIPKFYNVIARQDLNLNHNQVAKFVKKSFSQASATYIYDNLSNPLSSTSKAREEKSNFVLEIPFQNKEQEKEDDNAYVCISCENVYNESDIIYNVHGEPVCSDCVSENYVYVESVQEYYHIHDPNLYYNEDDSTYYHMNYDTVKECSNCERVYCEPGKSAPVPVYEFNDSHDNHHAYCEECLQSVADDKKLTVISCNCGSVKHISEFIKYTVLPDYIKEFLSPQVIFPSDSDSQIEPSFYYKSTTFIYCPKCIDKSVLFHQTCPCGSLKDPSDILKCSLTPVCVDNVDYQVTSACGSCIGNIKPIGDGYYLGEFVPKISQQFNKAVESKVILSSPYVISASLAEEQNNELF